MARGMSDMFLMLPLIYIMNQIDLTLPDNIFYVRVSFAIVFTAVLTMYGYMLQQIMKRNDTRTILVPKTEVSMLATPTNEKEELSIVNYDKGFLMKGLKQVLMGLLIMSFLHIKFEYVQPLFIQCFMNPMQLFKNPLFQIYVIGRSDEEFVRPFVEENPLASLMQPPNQEEGEETQPEGEEKEGEEVTEAIEDSKSESKQMKNRKKAKKAN